MTMRYILKNLVAIKKISEEVMQNISLPIVPADIENLLLTLDPTVLISVTDARGKIIYVNQRFLAVSKYTKDDLIGQNHRILKSGHQDESLFEELWKNIVNGKVWQGVIKNRAKDGSYFWVDTIITPSIGKNGKPSHYLATRTLITPADA